MEKTSASPWPVTVSSGRMIDEDCEEDSRLCPREVDIKRAVFLGQW
jgi:hypothetical protein